MVLKHTPTFLSLVATQCGGLKLIGHNLILEFYRLPWLFLASNVSDSQLSLILGLDQELLLVLPLLITLNGFRD